MHAAFCSRWKKWFVRREWLSCRCGVVCVDALPLANHHVIASHAARWRHSPWWRHRDDGSSSTMLALSSWQLAGGSHPARVASPPVCDPRTLYTSLVFHPQWVSMTSLAAKCSPGLEVCSMNVLLVDSVVNSRLFFLCGGGAGCFRLSVLLNACMWMTLSMNSCHAAVCLKVVIFRINQVLRYTCRSVISRKHT